MSDKPQKIYINGLFIKEYVPRDSQYPPILNISVNVETLTKELEQHNADGWVRIKIMRRQTPSAKGHTHYAELDTWKPKQENAPAKPAAPAAPAPASDDNVPY